MKGLVLFALCVLAVAGYQEEDDVLVLGDDDIQQALSEFPQLLVEFYAPWCGHCKKLAPEYAKAAGILKAQNPPIRIAKVDATANKESAEKYGVEGYPTLKFFENGNPSEYKGPREADGIVSWLNKKSGPTTQVIGDADQLTAYIEKSNVLIVLFADKDSEEAKVFEKVASASEDGLFVVSTSAEALETNHVQAPALVIFKKFDDRKVQYTGPFREKRVTDFVEKNKTPWVFPFDDKAIDYIFKKQNPVIFVFRAESEDGKYDALVREVVADVKDYIRFSTVDLTIESNKRLADYLGITASVQPTLLVVQPTAEGVLKYKFTESSITPASIKAFAEKYNKKQLEAFYKTEEIPEEPFDGSVRILVGKNFESIVLDSTKDVFVEFYAPWCGHCKKLAPEYEEVAQYFKDNPNVVIAKIDATANEVKGQGIQGFPTLRFFSSTNKTGVTFDGERNKQAIIDYIEKNGTVENRKTDL